MAEKPLKRGPKISSEGAAVVVAVSVPGKLMTALEKWRKREGLNKSQAVTEAIRRLLS